VFCQRSHSCIIEINAIICVSKPNDIPERSSYCRQLIPTATYSHMALDSFSFLKMKTMCDSAIVCVPFLDVRMTRCKMSRQEAKTSIVIVKPYSNCSLVSGHASQSCLTRFVQADDRGVQRIATFRDVPSTFLMTAVSSDLTRTSRAVPTSWTR